MAGSASRYTLVRVYACVNVCVCVNVCLWEGGDGDK